MKLRLPHRLLAAIIASALLPYAWAEGEGQAAASDLGTLMCVGDSISHGTGSYSYRWFLHKILVDNGIGYTATGYHTGGFSGGNWSAFNFNTTYGTETSTEYTNTHSAQFNAKLSDFANGNASNYNIPQLSTVESLGSTGTFTMMLGTNDLNQGTFNQDTSVGYAQQLVATMLAASPGATVYVMSTPVFSNGTTFSAIKNRNSAGTVQSYRDALATMAGSYDSQTLGGQTVSGTVKYVDVNKGITDVSLSTATSPWAVASMTASDGLHLQAQADLLIAGNLAKAMGYAGATAGLARKGTDDAGEGAFSLAASSHAATTAATTYSWDGDVSSDGFTACFNFTVGNGATDGWSTDALSVTVGNGSLSGTLNITEAYIKWGDTVLYSEDMSTLATTDTALRVAYTVGNAEQGVASGYYVWLGDMLIGEGLHATSSDTACNGLSVSATSDSYATLSNIYMNATGAYAPTALGSTNAEQAFTLTPKAYNPADLPGYVAVLPSDTAHSISASGGNVALVWGNNLTQFNSETNIVATVSSTVTQYAYANYVTPSAGNKNKSVDLTLISGNAAAAYYAHGSENSTGMTDAQKTLTGDVTMRLTENVAGAVGVYGVHAGGIVTGNVNIELSAVNAVYSTSNKYTPGIAGISDSGTSIGGKFHLQINAGTFNTALYGGAAGTSGTIGGGVELYVNGGEFNSYVFGGNYNGGTITGGVSMTVANAVFNHADAQILGGSYKSGTIEGGVTINLGAGTYQNIFGGNYNNGSITGGVTLNISGGDFSQAVTAGNYSGGSISGGVETNISGGTFSTFVFGGGYKGGTIGETNGTTDAVKLNITGGEFRGAVAGSGGRSGTAGTINGNVVTTVSGGTFKNAAALYGAGFDTINGNVSLTISGNAEFAAGTTIYAGGGNGRVNGNVSLTIEGTPDKALKINNISANNGATITGGVTMTFKGLTDTILKNSSGATYDGTIDGTVATGKQATLAFENSTLNLTSATVQNFAALTVDSSSNVTLGNLGGFNGDITVTDGTLAVGGSSALTVSDGKSFTVKGTGRLVAGSGDSKVTMQAQDSASQTGATASAGVVFDPANGSISGTNGKESTISNAKLTFGTVSTFSSKARTTTEYTLSGVTLENTIVNLAGGTPLILTNVTFGATSGISAESGATVAISGSTTQNISSESLTSTQVEEVGGSPIIVAMMKSNILAGMPALEDGSTLTLALDQSFLNTLIRQSSTVETKTVKLVFDESVSIFTDTAIGADKIIVTAPGAFDPVTVSYGGADNAVLLTLSANVPEPTTGTLSMLALAALASRRRRK